MRCIKRKITEKGIIFIFLNKFNCFVGVNFCKFSGVGGTFDYLPIADQWDSALIFEINDFNGVKIMKQTKVMIESLVFGQEGFVKTKVPFADAGCGVAILFDQFSDRKRVGVKACL